MFTFMWPTYRICLWGDGINKQLFKWSNSLPFWQLGQKLLCYDCPLKPYAFFAKDKVFHLWYDSRTIMVQIISNIYIFLGCGQ